MRFLRILVVCAVVCAASDTAERFYKSAQRAEKAGDILNAYLLYARAAALDPHNVQYAAKKAALRSRAALTAREELGPDPFEPIGPPIPATLGPVEMREANPPARLAGSKEKKTFDLRGDPRNIIEKVAEAYGIQAVFEADYQTPPLFTFRMTDVGMEEAFRALEAMTNSFFVPVTEKLALVVRDNPQKRSERAPAMTVAIPIPERMTVQDAQEIVQAVQQTLDIRRFGVDPTRHLVFIRAQASQAVAARQMFYNLSHILPQMELDVELLAVDKNSSLNYGIKLPSQFAIVNFKGLVSLPEAWETLMHLTSAASPYALGIADATVFATLAKSRTENMLNAQIVSLDGQAATLHVGQRFPIATNSYIGNTGGSGQVFVPPPTVNFEDLGLVLKVTPWIHEGAEVTLDLETEFKTLAAQSGVNGIPIVANRKFTGKVRLKENEWAVVAGLVQTSESETRTGWPWLSELPWIGRFLRQNQIDKNSSEVLVVLKPHITTLPAWELAQKSIWVGTETKPMSVY